MGKPVPVCVPQRMAVLHSGTAESRRDPSILPRTRRESSGITVAGGVDGLECLTEAKPKVSGIATDVMQDPLQ